MPERPPTEAPKRKAPAGGWGLGAGAFHLREGTQQYLTRHAIPFATYLNDDLG